MSDPGTQETRLLLHALTLLAVGLLALAYLASLAAR
jgi:hypothetical protein